MAALLLLATAVDAFAGENPTGDGVTPVVDLTPQERAWLAAHPVLRVGIDPDFAPYSFVDGAGHYSGIGAHYVRLLSRRLGIEFRVVPGLSWQQVVDKARHKELDLLAALARTPERSKFLKFTRAYVKFPFVIVTRRGHPAVVDVSDLSGERVVLVKDHAATELTLRHNPSIVPLYVDDMEQSSRAVAFGRADATVGDLASLDYSMQQDMLANLVVAAESEFQAHGLRMGVRDDWPVLASILNKALATVTPEEHRAIRRYWVGAQRTEQVNHQPRVELTEEEREWIQRHPQVVLGISEQWQPAVVTAADGAVTGMMPDLLRLLNARLGTDIRLKTGVWSEILGQAGRGEIDGLALSVARPSRARHFNFSASYAHAHKYVFVRSDTPPVRNLADLAGKKVAYTAGNEIDLSVLRSHPKMEPVECSDVEEKIKRLHNGEVDAAIGSTPLMYRLLNNFHVDIRVALTLPGDPEQLVFAVRKEWPELVAIIDKGLASITPAERAALYRRWIPVRYEPETDHSLLWKLLAGGALLFMVVLLWNRALSAKVAQRTGQFQEELLRRRQSEERFRLLYEYAPLPYQSLDAEGRFVTVNQAFEEVLGYTRDDVVGHPFSELMPTPERDQFRETFEKYLEYGQVHAGPRLLRKDGILIHTELAGVIARRPDGSLLQTHCLWADVTERKRAEEALRNQRDFLESIFNNVDYAVFVVDVTDDGEFRYAATNRRLQEWSHLSPGEISGKTPRELIPHITPEVADALQKKYQACAQTGDTVQYEELVPIKQKEIWWSTRLTPLKDPGGRVYQIIGTTIDITLRRLAERRLQEHQEHLEESVQARTRELEREIARRKQIEAELLTERDRVESASEAKSVFLANMSHELRTPLNAVLGYARILQKGADVSERQLEGLGIIEQGGRQLHTLINDILDIARIEAGRLVLEPAPLRLTGFLDEVVAIVRTRAQSKGIEVSLITETGLPAAVLADEKRLRQILLNLLSNAVKFTNEGRVVLRVSSVGEPGSEASSPLKFEVQDTGIGIAADQLQRIFQPFEQVGQPGQEEGAGLGLAIAKQLVEKMGGSIRVESAQGKGSRFWCELEFPVEDATERVQAEPPPLFVGYRGPRHRLLVVDDNKINCLFLKELLESRGFLADPATGGKEGLAMVHSERPDLLLLDILMPDMDGYAVLDALRQDPQLQDLPVVAVSADVSKEQRAKAEKAGFGGFIEKPIIIEELFGVVGDLLGLEWQAGEGSLQPVSTREVIEPPPADKLAELGELLRLGKLTRAVEWAEALERRAPQYAPFARRVRGLALDLDEEGLKRLMDAS